MDAPTDAKVPSDTDSKNEKEPKETVTPAHDHGTVRAGVTDEKDLDPVALNKAFKFAAWSSVALVRGILLTQTPTLIDPSFV
jgi:urea-proton symporter